MDINQRILSDITVFMKYAKYLPEKNRRETWTELVDRNKTMHIEKFPYLIDEIEEAYKFVYDKKVLPSMRSLQFAGKPIEMNPTRLFNCCALPVDDYRAFSEIMFLLLGGTGVGFSVQKHHVEKLPEIRKPRLDRRRRFLVSDSIEGWADAINVLMKSYFFGGPTINFDCSDIRPKGARLITAGGKAPGPQPLKDCIFKIQGILDAKNDGEQLTTVEVHDIACHLADAVLVGGQRRAALISLFSADDAEMISCKSGNWWELNPHRGRANNSAVLLRNKITKDFFLELWKRIELSNAGEPGIYFSYDKDWLVNPCCFAGKTPLLTETGYESIENLVGDCRLVNKNGDVVDGKVWSNGVKDVIRLKFTSDIEIVCTPEHRFMLIDGSEEEAKNLKGKLVKTIHNSLDYDVVTDIVIDSAVEVFDFSLNDDTHWGVVGNGIVAHNCEIALRPFQMCNLTEVNVSNVVGQRDLNDRVKAAAFIGTLQASYTDFHYLRPIWQRTTEKDALIGVSMTGIASNVVTNLDLTEAAETVKLENARVAGLIGINPAARTTCIKPAGCRPWNGLVTTNDGILTLQELFINHNENSKWTPFNAGTRVYQNDEISQKITKTFHNGVDHVYSIKLEGQIELQCTKNHPWFVTQNYNRKTKSRYTTIDQFVATENLKIGDIIDIKLGSYIKETHYKFQQVNMFNIRMRDNTSEILQPKELNGDIAWLLGYLWGDGSLSEHKYRIRFTDQNYDNLYKANEIILNSFGLSGNIIKCKNKNAYSLEIGSIQLYHWFSQNGIRKYFNNNIDLIPECVRRSSREDIISFIAGLIDSDGTVYKRNGSTYVSAMISQKHSIFTRHLQDVAASVGIHLNHSFNLGGKSFAPNKNMVLLSISSFSLKESIDVLSQYCEKYKRFIVVENLPMINNSICSSKQLLGKVLSIDYVGEMETYDVEIENEPWFYAGAVKSHNTTSLTLGTASGIHAWHDEYYIRRIRVGKNESIYNYLVSFHPELVEDEFFRPHDTAVISIPQKAPVNSITRDEDVFDLLERIKRFSIDWIKPGHLNGQNTHNVSATVSIKPDEWISVGEWMWENRNHYSGLSVLPFDNGSYIQSPFQTIDKETYEKLAQTLTDIDLTNVLEFDDNTDLQGEAACAGGQCSI